MFNCGFRIFTASRLHLLQLCNLRQGPQKSAMMSEIDIVSIATNGYTRYWLKMVESFVQNNKAFKRVVIHLITDDPDFVALSAPKKPWLKYATYSVGSEPWPYPTLLRYRYISEVFNEIETDNFMYIDSDMLFHPGFDSELARAFANNDLNFVAHPGYWQSDTKNRIELNSVSFRSIIAKSRRKLVLGSQGAWETRQASSAFVPRKDRKNYICGGVWFGNRESIRVMIHELEKSTDMDLENGIIAKWHDESHINRWYSEFGGNLLKPDFCFDPTYPNLANLKPKIEAVNKGFMDRV
jgi:hypothetical protein